MKPMSETVLFRLYRILASARRPLTRAELGNEIGLSCRQITRLLGLLDDMQVPIVRREMAPNRLLGYYLPIKKCPCCGNEK